MKRVVSLAIVMSIVALGAVVAAAPPQQPGKAPQGPLGDNEAVLRAWNSVGRKLVAMAEDFPEDKYDFKPNPAQRSFAEQLLHVAGTNDAFNAPLKGQKPGPEDLPRDKYKTKADVVAVLKKSFADGAALIKEKGDSGMSEMVTHPWYSRQTHIWVLAMNLIEHSGEHYGQLVVYYRASNLVPPESRPKK